MAAKDTLKKSRLARLSAFGGVVAGVAGDAVGAVRVARRTGLAAEIAFHQRVASRLLESFGEMRGLPMKFGQMLSYVDDMVPKEFRDIYRQTLSGLRVHAEPMSWETMARVIEAEFGRPPEAVFEAIDQTPIAAASIGQVYRARFLGRDVAVKVQYPGVSEAIESDMKNAEALMSTLSKLIPKSDVRTSMDDIASRLREECDYTIEGQNQRDFSEAWRADPEIHIPEVLEARPRVLITELCEGDEWEPMLARSNQEVRSRYGQILARFVFHSLHIHGMFNADPHPGNYAFRSDGGINFFDFGCVQRFTRQDVLAFEEVQEAALRGERGAPLRARIGAVYGIPSSLDDELWGVVEEYVLLGFEPILMPQPYRYGPDYTQRLGDYVLRAKLVAAKKIRKTGLWDAKRPGVVFLHRINYGVASLLARLEAEVDWGRIVEEARARTACTVDAAGGVQG
ncbi:MAG: AarF/ABC1/UbiB kinase family protein [Deltaproteobacteria bacterium]|nr:AarF/ABC1/UbiB kinase family protein [Deltaproteobacteria bacterium]